MTCAIKFTRYTVKSKIIANYTLSTVFSLILGLYFFFLNRQILIKFIINLVSKIIITFFKMGCFNSTPPPFLTLRITATIIIIIVQTIGIRSRM